MSVILDIPFSSESLNTLMGWKFSPKMRRWKPRAHKAQWVHAISLAAMGKITAPETRKMSVTFVRFSSGTLDTDNLIGGFKPARDALKTIGAIVDDSPKWLEAEYFQVKTKRGDQRTRIMIRPA